MHSINNTELSSHEGTRCQFNGGPGAIKLGIDVHQDFYVVVEQVDGGNPSRRSDSTSKRSALGGQAQAKWSRSVAVYEACGFGFRCSGNLRLGLFATCLSAKVG